MPHPEPERPASTPPPRRLPPARRLAEERSVPGRRGAGRRDARARASPLTILNPLAPRTGALSAKALRFGFEVRVVRWRFALKLPPRLLLVRGHQSDIDASLTSLIKTHRVGRE
jgi:hypothetical protein